MKQRAADWEASKAACHGKVRKIPSHKKGEQREVGGRNVLKSAESMGKKVHRARGP